MPTFLLGLLLIQIFALTLNIFPAGAPAAVSQSSSLMGAITRPARHDASGRHADPGLGGRVLQVHALLGARRAGAGLHQAARAKGLPERLVLTRHLVRNACLPMVTLIGLSIPALLAGNLITENVFNYPGLGIMFINALNQRGLPDPARLHADGRRPHGYRQLRGRHRADRRRSADPAGVSRMHQPPR